MSAARSSSPPVESSPPVSARQGHVPVTSLFAAPGPQPVRRLEEGGIERAEEEKREESTVPTPPASDHEASPALEGRESSLEERREVVVREETRVAEVEEPRQHPTLLDLLGMPGPLRSPSPPLATVEAGEEKEEGMVVVREEMQLPTPELTPTEEVAAGDVGVQVDVEVRFRRELPDQTVQVAVSCTPTPPRRSLPPEERPPVRIDGSPAAADGSPAKASSLPPSSPPRDPPPIKIDDSPVETDISSIEADD